MEAQSSSLLQRFEARGLDCKVQLKSDASGTSANATLSREMCGRPPLSLDQSATEGVLRNFQFDAYSWRALRKNPKFKVGA
jgi:hypothetical protein